jgi:hypothetical protein
MYAPEEYYDNWEPLVFEVFNGMNNLNYFVERVQPYEAVGRNQTEVQADGVARDMLETLNKHGVKMNRVLQGDEAGCEIMARDILSELEIE